MEVERTNANAVERNEENFQSARENRQLMSFPIVSSLLAVVYQVDNWSQYVAIVEANFKKRKRKSPWAYSHKNIPIDRPRVLYTQFQWVRVPLSYTRQSTMMAFKSRATGTFWIPSMTYQILLWTNNKLLGQYSRFVDDLIKFSDFSYHVTRFLFLKHPGNESFNICMHISRLLNISCCCQLLTYPWWNWINRHEAIESSTKAWTGSLRLLFYSLPQCNLDCGFTSLYSTSITELISARDLISFLFFFSPLIKLSAQLGVDFVSL